MLIQKRSSAVQAAPSGASRNTPVGRDEKSNFAAFSKIARCFRLLLVPGLMALGSGFLRAQAAAEYGGAASRSAVTALPASKVVPSDLGKTANLTHIPARGRESAEDVNRHALETHAGKDAAKLMLRSAPTRAQVRIDGKLVGRTPLLLILAPGAYNVSLDGERMSSAEKRVDVLPRETREVLLPLESRYPAHVQLR